MKSEFTATVVDGRLDLDAAIDLPDETRVAVTIVTLTRDGDRREAVEEFLRLTDEHPISSGGLRYTRDELHERD